MGSTAASSRPVPSRGEIVRRTRLARGLTQDELGKLCGCSASVISRLETGRQPLTDIGILQKLASALAIPIERLVLSSDSGSHATAQSAIPRPRAAPNRFRPPRQLPANAQDFVGRESEISKLDALLVSKRKSPAVVVCTISGTAGVGKSALARHWAHRVASRFPDGQLYVDLCGFDSSGIAMDPADAVRGFLDAFGVDPQDIPKELDNQAGLYRSLLADKRVLVMLDNARDTDQVRRLLPGTPGCLVIVTSRDILRGLVAREGARPLGLELLTDAEATELLTSRLGEERVTSEPQAVREMIQACVGLPLALTIVAARAATRPRFSLRSLATELRDTERRLDLLTSEGDHDVRTAFSWSYDLLTREAQRLFRRLGLHPGREASAHAIASLAGLPLDHTQTLLSELARVHLVAEQAPDRYGLHDLLREYARELANAHDSDIAREAAVQRMLEYYVHTADNADRQIHPGRDRIELTSYRHGVVPEHPADNRQAMEWFGTEHLVLGDVLRDAARSRLDTHVWRLAWCLDTFLGRQGHWHDRAEFWELSLQAALRLGDQRAQALAHSGAANADIALDRLDSAHAHLQSALDLCNALGDPAEQARAHGILGQVLDRQGRYAEALDHIRQVLTLFETTRNRHGQANALNDIGWLHVRVGDYVAAVQSCEQALALYQELGDRDGEARTWDSLGYARHHLGRHQAAVDCYNEALQLFREFGDRESEAKIRHHLGDAQHATGDHDTARESWQQALEIFEALAHPEAERLRGKLHPLYEPTTE